MAKKRTRSRKKNDDSAVESIENEFVGSPDELDIDWGTDASNDKKSGAKEGRSAERVRQKKESNSDSRDERSGSSSERSGSSGGRGRARGRRSQNSRSASNDSGGDNNVRNENNSRNDGNSRNEGNSRNDGNSRGEGGGGRGARGRRRRGGNNNGNNNNNGGGRNARGNNSNNNSKSRGGNSGGGGRRQKRHSDPVEFDDVELTEGIGMLEMHPNGYGFLRSPENNFSRERSDPFVPGTMIEKFALRPGVLINAKVQPARRQQGPRVRELIDVDGLTPEEYLEVKNFDQLTPINPEQWYQLETGPEPLTTRVMDLLTPLGKGQRALIVAPPRSGKTIMMQHIAHGIATNHPGSKLIVLLIDERPEEVTDMRRNVNGEVIASSLDEDIESHVRLSQLVIQRCKRLAEMGQDVFLLMDSITRLARAFNKWVGNTGRTMSGGVDIKAMDIPKKLFSSARAFEEGGSLTIVGTALIDTGSRMDELIFQEFKGTGNMELVLDRKLADRRVWPAIDISQSGTRREELLLKPETLEAVTMLRRTLSTMHPVDAMEQLTKQLGKRKNNDEFIMLISGKLGNM